MLRIIWDWKSDENWTKNYKGYIVKDLALETSYYIKKDCASSNNKIVNSHLYNTILLNLKD